MAKDLNYYQTLIAVADDCPVASSRIPMERDGKRTVAVIQYEMLANSPYVYTQEDVLFHTWLHQQPLTERSEAELAQLREQFFAKPRACLRASPLPKQYGWGLHFDPDGRIALCPMESEEYRQLVTGERVKVRKAMRSSRAAK